MQLNNHKALWPWEVLVLRQDITRRVRLPIHT